MNIDEYFEKINNKKEKDYWFLTKQTVTDIFIPLFCCFIAEDYTLKKPSRSFSEHFKTLAGSLGYTENAYRNKIIPEYMGLLKQNPDSADRYSKYETTDSFKTISKIIKTKHDLSKTESEEILTKQLEKMAMNVYKNNRKYETVKNITVFPLMFMYKVLILLEETHNKSVITWDEFIFFIIRAKNNKDSKEIVDLIIQYRNSHVDYVQKYKDLHQFNNKDMRLNNLLAHSKHLIFRDKAFSLVKKDINIVKTKLSIFENSQWYKETNKNKIMNFMQSSEYFTGYISDYIKGTNDLLNNIPVGNTNNNPVEFEPTKSPRRITSRELDTYSTHEVDPINLQKASLQHEKLVNKVAEIIKELFNAQAYENQTDLYFFNNKTIHIMEMKTITNTNWRKQLRTALGQILQYEHFYFKVHYPDYNISKHIFVDNKITDSEWENWISFLNEFDIQLNAVSL